MRNGNGEQLERGDRLRLSPHTMRGSASNGRIVMIDVELPDEAEFVRSTPDFDEHSVPAGLLAAHRVADGVWGRLVVSDGSIVVVFEDDPAWRYSIAAGSSQVLPPGVRHHVEIVGPVQFAVEFHRVSAETAVAVGEELVDE